MERARGITIQSAAVSFNWPPRQHHAREAASGRPEGTSPKTINLIDTPGHQDFRFEVDRCLPVLDGAVCIIDAVKGVEAHTERVWASAQQHGIPRLVFVNKLDRDGASFQRSVLDIATRLNAHPLVCQLPLWDKSGDQLHGVVDVIAQRALRWTSPPSSSTSASGGTCSLVPDEHLRAMHDGKLWAEMETARARLVERLCEDDDELVEAFAALEPGKDLPAALIKASLRRVMVDSAAGRTGRVVPVFAGASLRNVGVEPLLDAIVDYLPSPRQAPDVEVRLNNESRMLGDVWPEAASSSSSPSSPSPSPSSSKQAGGALASVFKVVNDPNLFPGAHGMLAFVRVYRGSLHKNAQVWNANLARFERPFHIAQVSASKIGEIPYLAPGQIGAVTGLKAARTGDTLHILPPSAQHHQKGRAGANPGSLRTMTIRPPEVGPAVAFVSVEAYGGATETKRLAEALEKLAREDPSLRWSRGSGGAVGDADADSAIDDSFVLSGLGQLHLDVAMDRLRTTYGVSATFSDVQVDYKECLTVDATAAQRHVYDRVVANKAGMAACTVTLEQMAGDVAESVAGTGKQTFTFEREGNLVRVQFENSAAEGEPGPGARLPFDADMVSRQLFSGAYAALARGPRRGSPLHGCRVTIVFDAATDYGGPGTDGHIVNGALLGVRSALRAAHARGHVAVLEPVMDVHIAAPDDSAGAIQRDITGSRGGVILEVREAGSHSTDSTSAAAAASGDADTIDIAQVYAPPDPYATEQSLRDPKRGMTRLLEIVARVPLKEMLAYDSRLRSMTGGRHSFTMELGSFERVVGTREKDL